MDKLNIPEFKDKKELFKFLVENKSTLEAQKKAETKHADSVMFIMPSNSKKTANKSEANIDSIDELKVKVVINTTNLIDSHSDMHVPGIWDKSLKENKSIMHLQEHVNKFDHLIADSEDITAYTQNYTFKELGFDIEGKTQALVFESTIRKDVNPYMFKLYYNGRVKEHSVGMRYVKLVMAVNDEDWGAEFEAWEKYYPDVANKEVADAQGYFWVVKEAKVVEGSAVLKGSNYATPTLTVESKNEPLKGTHKDNNEPSIDTQEVKQLISNFKIF